MAISLNTITLGGLPVYDPPEGVVGLNRFSMRTGASRYGRGAFVMLRSDYDKLVDPQNAQAKNGIVKLVMTGSPGPGLTVSVVVAGAEPISVATGNDRSKDLVKVTVYDQRSRNFGYVRKAYNVSLPGFPLDGSNNPICYTSTLNGSNTWTWSQLITDTSVVQSNAMPSDISTWTPLNIIFDAVPAARVVDDIAAQLFLVVGYDHQANTFTLFDPGGTFSDGSNATLYQQATQAGAQIGGGDGFRNTARMPGNIVVTFPAVGGGDPFNSHRVYQKTVASGFTGAGTDFQLPLHVGNQVAFWNGSAWANQANLDAVATDIAAGFCTFLSQPILQYELAGIWAFKPDGKYRQVEWISDKDGARTILKSDNAKDWLPTDQLNDPLNGTSPQEVIALGGGISGIGSGGIKYAAFWRPQFVLTGAATRYGTYTGHTWMAPSAQFNPTTSGTFAQSDIGTASSDTVYLINKREVGQSTHDLDTSGSFQPMIFSGDFLCTAPDGKPCYLIDGFQPETC